MFKSFGFNLPNGTKKRFTLLEIQSFKTVVMAELRAGVLESSKLSLKLYLRIKNPDRQVSSTSRDPWLGRVRPDLARGRG